MSFEFPPELRSGVARCDKLSTTEARNNIAEVWRRSAYKHRRTIIEQHGKPVAAVIPLADLVTLLRHDRDVYAEMAKRVPENLEPDEESLEDALLAAAASQEPDSRSSSARTAVFGAEPVTTRIPSKHRAQLPSAESAPMVVDFAPIHGRETQAVALQTILARLFLEGTVGPQVAARVVPSTSLPVGPQERQIAHEQLDQILTGYSKE